MKIIRIVFFAYERVLVWHVFQPPEVGEVFVRLSNIERAAHSVSGVLGRHTACCA